jgi:uncharacterized membrane protein YdjX (TVP38/TMEM64 family)
MRFFFLFLALVALVFLPFLLWGDVLEAAFTQAGAAAWLSSYGRWAWAAGLALLVVDLFLPVPATVVMAALGYVYGAVVGGLVAAAGSFLAGTLAYWLCRRFGRGVARRIAGAAGLEKGERLFATIGGWLVALSRWLPVLPEVVACMAGLARMPARTFHLALACGSVPLGFTFAALGQAGAEQPVLALVLSAGLPPVLWLVVQPFLRAKARAR